MANIQAAREAAAQVALMGAFPVTPHLLGHGLEDAGDEQFWYDGTLELMLRCDAVYLVPGWDQSGGVLVGTVAQGPEHHALLALRGQGMTV